MVFTSCQSICYAWVAGAVFLALVLVVNRSIVQFYEVFD
jgi:hypothetical protein